MLESISKFLFDSISILLKDPIWSTVGFVGQVTFGSRFILQWIVSEYKKKSHVPTAFWYISVVGSIILLIYSIHIKNPVFMLGFSLNTFIYLRNLHLIHRHAKSAVAAAVEAGED